MNLLNYCYTIYTNSFLNVSSQVKLIIKMHLMTYFKVGKHWYTAGEGLSGQCTPTDEVEEAVTHLAL